MGMREVMQALSEGAGRQSAIGGLMFQDAQMREGRSYEEAMAKERERRENLEWKRRFDVSTEEARGLADIEHGYRMTEQQARLTSAETEGALEREGRMDIATLQETGATNRTESLILGRADAAGLLAQARVDERAEDRRWAIEDALSKAKSDTAKATLEAKIDRAKKAEDHLSELYKGLKDAGVEWDDDTKTYVSGSDYMDQIHRAQDRVEAAWATTGVPALMEERNLNSIRLGFLEQSIVGVVSLELKDQQWADVVNGLQSEKGSGDYKEALETINGPIERAIDASRIRVTNSERERILDAVIERIGTYKGELDEDVGDKKGDKGDGDVAAVFTQQQGSIARQLDRIPTDITVADVGAFGRAVAERRGGTPGRGGGGQRRIENAAFRDPEWLLPRLESERDRLTTLIDSPNKKGGPRGVGAVTSQTITGYRKKLERVNRLIDQMTSILQQKSALDNQAGGVSTTPSLPQVSSRGDLGDGDVEGMQVAQTQQPAGFLNQQGGMISRADELSYAPEDVNARWA